jgi:hypothetical protein
MEYVILKDEETGEVEKIGRFLEGGITERFDNGAWVRDRILYSELLDGLLEKISETEAERLIALQVKGEKIAA